MFEINDKVIHSREGLSTIVGKTEMAGNEYFIIHSDHGNPENIYVLINNTGKLIRPIMDKKSADGIISYMKEIPAEFITNTKQRRDQYKRKLLSGDVHDLAYLARQLYFYYSYNENGVVVKLGPTDVQMLKDAEGILLDELSLSYKIPREKMGEFLSVRLS